MVIDIGTQTTRAGYAGEEIPRCVVPTAYGYIEVEVDEAADTNGKSTTIEATSDVPAVVNGEENAQATEPAAVDEEKAQDEKRQEAADKDDAMEGIEEPKEQGESSNKAESAAAEVSAGDAVMAAQDDRLPPSERQRQGSAAAPADPGASKEQPRPSTKKIRQKKYYVGEEGVNVWRAGMEVGSMVTDGISEWSYVYLKATCITDRHALHSHRLRTAASSPLAHSPRQARRRSLRSSAHGDGTSLEYASCEGDVGGDCV